VECADLIHGKDKGLLSRQNYKGDTPLHCAARAGMSQMVSHLIDLATGDNIVKDLVRQENNSNETVLHVAIRNGAHELVDDLLKVDPNLACFPQQGTSPLYLAILLEHETIAQTLYEKSENNVLSYSGPNGQNALHAAVLRGPGTYLLEAYIYLFIYFAGKHIFILFTMFIPSSS
jgi:ankyrin repeat protein